MRNSATAAESKYSSSRVTLPFFTWQMMQAGKRYRHAILAHAREDMLLHKPARKRLGPALAVFAVADAAHEPRQRGLVFRERLGQAVGVVQISTSGA